MAIAPVDTLRREFQFYRDNQNDMVEKYDGKTIVIKNGVVLGAYNSAGEALKETKKAHELGSFLIQKVSEGNKDYTRTFRSRVRLP